MAVAVAEQATQRRPPNTRQPGGRQSCAAGARLHSVSALWQREHGHRVARDLVGHEGLLTLLRREQQHAALEQGLAPGRRQEACGHPDQLEAHVEAVERLCVQPGMLTK